MSHTKIATKILEIMKVIPNEQAFEKINESLFDQKLVTKTEYKIVESKEQITRNGLVLRIVTVSCELTIIDTESDEVQTNIALGSGLDATDRAVDKAQMRAQKIAWMTALNIISEDVPFPESVSEPEIIVETPESKLIAEIKTLWKWDPALFDDYFIKRRGKPLSELNIPELTVERDDLQSYIRGNG